MSNIKDVLFVSVDGLGDFFRNYNKNEFALKRIEKVKEIKKKLKDYGLNVVLLNPLDDADIKIPVFGLSYNNNTFTETDLDYSVFLLKHLYDYIKNISFSHVIIFQYDGFPINLDQWDDSFLNYEFLGMAEHISVKNDIIYYDDLTSVEKKFKGFTINGGFSLRSRELLQRCKDIPLDNFKKLIEWKRCTNEDLIILDFIDINKMPQTKDIFEKFVDNKPETKSFGFHKNE